jgi:hypothetical protein
MNKIILRYDRPFWGKDTAVLRTVPEMKEGPVFFVDGSCGKDYIIVGLIVQNLARTLSAMPDAEVFDYFNRFLTKCMSVPLDSVKLLQGKYTRWDQ